MKAKQVVGVIALLLALTGCQPVMQPETVPTTGGYVRFSNETYNPGVGATHGIRVSEAVYIGALLPGESTNYFSFTNNGDYAVQTYNGSVWTDLTSLWPWGGGNRYTVKLTGTELSDLVISHVVD